MRKLKVEATIDEDAISKIEEEYFESALLDCSATSSLSKSGAFCISVFNPNHCQVPLEIDIENLINEGASHNSLAGDYDELKKMAESFCRASLVLVSHLKSWEE